MEYKKENWLLSRYDADYPAITRELGITEIPARILRNRGLTTVEEMRRFIAGDLMDCHDSGLMKDMDKGCQIVMKKIREGRSIRIVSDYDVDGITSNYILYDALRALGAVISYDIPDRIRDGYGINERIVEVAHRDGVDTIITCDNGIAAYPAVARAKDYGMTVIITDHHEVKYEPDTDGNPVFRLPSADAIIDIKQEDCPYPYKGLCGAGVAYKFVRHLYRMMEVPWEDEERYLEILAMGTVCDVMPLTDENRIYVKRGLRRMEHTTNLGLRTLLRVNRLEGKELVASHLGFRIGPCLNSTGRLESAKQGVELLLETDEDRAHEMAVRMTELNEERKAMTDRGVKDAIEYVLSQYEGNVIVLYLPGIHESVAGLVASKVKDVFYHPTLVCTDAENGTGLKGSGRSIEGYNMFEELSKCSEYFSHFGGHPMAAGFSLARENLDALRLALNEQCTMTEEEMIEQWRIDASIPLSDLSVSLVRELEKLEPYGVGNPSPLFGLLKMRIKKVNLVGDNKQYAQITFATENGATIRGMDFNGKQFMDNIKLWFNADECDKILSGVSNHVVLDVLYHPGINEYNGRTTVQIRPVSYRKSEL